MGSPPRSPTDHSHERRPGGGIRRDSERTSKPRKVQWLDDQAEEGLSTETPTHLLDEYGIDMEAFEKLTTSLEQHRRATPLGKIHYYPPQPQESPSSSTSSESIRRAHGDWDDSTPAGAAESFYDSSAASSRTFDSVYPATRSPSPTYDVPDNYIDPEERAGLPGTRDLTEYSRRQAAKVIEAHIKHTKRERSRRQRYRRKGATKQPRSPLSHTMDYTSGEDSDRDVERHAGEVTAGAAIAGGGLLSAILNLYDHQGSSISGSSSGFSSADESAGETDQSDHYSENEEGQSERRDEERYRHHGNKREHREDIEMHHLRKFRWPSLPGNIRRPSQARTAGGVFGPLIASTGNLAGWIAPASSQLQPNLERSGYRLSRYSLEGRSSISRPLSRDPDGSATDTQQYSPTSTAPSTPPPSPTETPPFMKSNWPVMLSKEFPYVSSIRSTGSRSTRTPTLAEHEDQWYDSQRHPAGKAKKKRHKRKKAEVYITRHVAKIIQREEFILKLTRAMMMFGGPPHRLQSQIQSAGRVLDVELSLLYFPDVALVSFDDSATGTSHIKLIRQASSLDLGKLDDAYLLYWKVIHDKLSVSTASTELDNLMRKKPMYNWWNCIILGGLCSSAICTVSFAGSFIDAVVSFPLGALLVAIQTLSAKNVLYSYVFEFTITLLFSFIAAALAATHHLCYSAIASSSVVLILPGFLVLTGSLELMSRHIVSGSVRICYAVVYALILGFGFTMGAEFYELFTHTKVYGAEDYNCTASHDAYGSWYQRTPSKMWAFLTVPMFSTFLSMRNQAPYNRKELYLLVGIACIGWVTNYFTGTRFVGQSDISAAVGAFAVGLVANVYARIFSGNAFVVMITGILFQLPSGLGSGGLLSYASEQTSGSTTSYISGFRTALKLVSVAIGLAIGLGLSLSIAHPIQSKKREAGIFSL